MTVSASKRLQEMAAEIETTGMVKAQELSQRYQVSMETIRKDLTILEEQGIAKKIYGGAVRSILSIEKRMEYRLDRQEEKHAIAQYAVSMLQDQHSLLLDSGSTCYACVPLINSLSSMDIITASIPAFEGLDGERHNVFLPGGKKREKNRSLVGNWTVAYLERIQADICFLGTCGFFGSDGPCAHSYQELDVKQAMIKHSDLVFVLADSEKFQKKGFHTYANWDAIDGIITDSHLSPRLYEEYSKFITVYMCEGDM